MLKITSILAGILIISCLNSCTDSFEELNTDPNRLSKIGPSTLLNPLLYNMASVYAERSYEQTFNLMQVMITYPSLTGGMHRYDISEGVGNSIWNNSYKWLANIREMQKSCQDYNDNTYMAVSYTLEAMMLANLTDVFGDIPMNEAAKGEKGIFEPQFNTQQEVYDSVFSKLYRANILYHTSPEMNYKDDLLYHNSKASWQKFNNSLLLRSLLRVSGVKELNANYKLAELLSNPDSFPIIENRDESASLIIDGVYPNESPWSRYQDFRTGKTYCTFFFENLNNFNDPRLPFFAGEAKDIYGQSIGYIGIPAGYKPDNVYEYTPSLPNSDQVITPMKIPFITYAEVEFIKAELYLKGIVSGNAKLSYENGVKSAIYYMTGTEVESDYFNSKYTSYNSTLERIMLQKYYALYFTDYQQWFEYRRTGFPVLDKLESTYRDAMPKRFYYPPDTKAFNKENVQVVLDRMGGKDDLDYPLFWDVN